LYGFIFHNEAHNTAVCLRMIDPGQSTRLVGMLSSGEIEGASMKRILVATVVSNEFCSEASQNESCETPKSMCLLFRLQGAAT